MRSVALLVLLATMTSALGCIADDEMLDDADGEPVVSSESEIVLKGYSEPKYGASERARILADYDHLDRSGVVPGDLLDDAILFFHANKAKIKNLNYLSVVDFSKQSGQKRFFLVDLKSGAVRAHVVAHGSGSDPGHTGMATKFSNVSGSNASSLGYYVTAETYSGKHGRSLRLDGVSKTNSKARARAVVIHGAGYVREGAPKQGRSWGCPALAESVKDGVIDALRHGGVLYIGVSTGEPRTTSSQGAKPNDDDVPTQADSTPCRGHGDCNPGEVGSGEMCVEGRCVPGCLTDWMCPGTCDVARKRCR